MRFDIDVAFTFSISIAILYLLMKYVKERLEEREMFIFYVYGLILGIGAGILKFFVSMNIYMLILLITIQEGIISLLGIYRKIRGLEVFLSCAGLGVAAGYLFMTFLSPEYLSELEYYLAGLALLISYSAVQMFNGSWIGRTILQGRAIVGLIVAIIYTLGFSAILTIQIKGSGWLTLVFALFYSLPSLYLTFGIYRGTLRA